MISEQKKEVKREITKMLIPIAGMWFLLSRALECGGNITWWDMSKRAIPTGIALILYQTVCFLVIKLITL